MREPAPLAVIPASRFADEYPGLVREGRCAVVTGLFDGQPITALTDIAKARELLGGCNLVMGRNYADSKLDGVRGFLQGRKAKHPIARETTSFADYLDLAIREPNTRWIIGEQPAPAPILGMAGLERLGIDKIESGYVPRHAARAQSIAHALIFVANGTNGSELHTDWDGQDVLLYEGFGRKRVTVFPAGASPLLHPVDVYGTVRLAGMAEPKRREFLRIAGGTEHILEPGEAMFMPAFVWHHVEYLELAMSVSIRFGGIDDSDALFLIDNIHRDQYVQNLMTGRRNPATAAACRAAIRDLRQAYDRPYDSAREKYRAMRQLAKRHCLSLGLMGEDFSQPTWIDFEDLLEGAQIASYQFLAKGSALARWFWHSRERSRSIVRRVANRLAHWA